MKCLGMKVHGEMDYCGHCGRSIEGVPQFGVGLRHYPFTLYGELVYDDDAAKIIESGGILVIPVCSEVCRELYMQHGDLETEEDALLAAQD